MAWSYAPHVIPGLHGYVSVHVAGRYIEGYDPLPPGTQTMTIAYWYYPTAADVAAGVEKGVPTRVSINFPITVTAQDIRLAINEQRRIVRQTKSWGYPPTVAWKGA